MAMTITDDCTACGVCEPECPNEAISEADPIYVIDAEKCTECADVEEGPQCVKWCPKEALELTTPDQRSQKARHKLLDEEVVRP